MARARQRKVKAKEPAETPEPDTAKKPPATPTVLTGGPVRWSDWGLALGLWAIAIAVYTEGGVPMLDLGQDVIPSIWLPLPILRQGRLTFDSINYPFFFNWAQLDQRGERKGRIPSFRKFDEYAFQDMKQKDVYPITAGDALDNGLIGVDTATPALGYNVYPSKSGGVVCTFGTGTGLIFTPVVWAATTFGSYDLNQLADPDNFEQLAVLAHYTASGLVAASAALVYLTARHLRATRTEALVVAVLYAFGTCVWSISAKALWQHGPVNFCSALGLLLQTKAVSMGDSRSHTVCRWLHYIALGTTVGFAVHCRPSAVFVPICLGLWLLAQLVAKLRHGRPGGASDAASLFAFVLGGAPWAAAIGIYNLEHFGTVFASGQTLVSVEVAKSKTGSPDLWATPLFDGFATLMVSPSRGLLALSPWCIIPVAFAVWSLASTCRQLDRTAPDTSVVGILAPWAAAATIQAIFAFKWFDFYGGWCFGYRPIVDIVPVIAMFLVPTLPHLRKSNLGMVGLLSLGVYSVGVQVVGAMSYNIIDWNGQMAVTWHNPDGTTAHYLPCPILSGSVENPPQDALQAAFNAYPTARGFTSELKCARKSVDDPQFRWRLWDWERSQPRFFYDNFWGSRERTNAKLRDIGLSMKTGTGDRLSDILAGRWKPPPDEREASLAKLKLTKSPRVLGGAAVLSSKQE